LPFPGQRNRTDHGCLNGNLLSEAFVWIWLPGSTEPVVAGRVEKHGTLHHFTYGRSYRGRDKAIALSPFALPLQTGTFELTGMNTIHSCLRDAAPDVWGRRVVGYKYPDLAADELDYQARTSSMVRPASAGRSPLLFPALPDGVRCASQARAVATQCLQKSPSCPTGQSQS
jgi:hypothetical protein